jgi:hypothetical protein
MGGKWVSKTNGKSVVERRSQADWRAKAVVNAILQDPATPAYRHYQTFYASQSNVVSQNKVVLLLKRPEVEAYWRRQVAKLEQQFSKNAGDVAERLIALGWFDIRQVARWDASGNLTIRASDKLSVDEAAAIKKIKHTTTPGGATIIELEFHDPVRSMSLFMRQMGYLNKDQSQRPMHIGAVVQNNGVIVMPPMQTEQQVIDEATK